MAGTFRAAMAVLGLLLVVLLGAGLVMGKAGLFSDPAKHTVTSAAATSTLASRPAGPPSDTAPARIETATFALG